LIGELAMPLLERTKKQIRESDKSNTEISLDLKNLGLFDEDIKELEILLEDKKNITSIDITKNNIGSDGCKNLARLQYVKKMNLSRNNIGDKGLKVLLENKKNIEELDLSENCITDKGVKLLVESGINFKKLNLFGNGKISSNGIKTLKEKFPEAIVGDSMFFSKTAFSPSFIFDESKSSELKEKMEVKDLVENIILRYKNEIKQFNDEEKKLLIKLFSQEVEKEALKPELVLTADQIRV
jgi:hypothetical protein